MAKTKKTCLPTINNYGEYRKAPVDLFSATANRRKCLKKSKSLRQTANGANLFSSPTANRKIALFLSPTANCKKGVFFCAYGDL